MSRSAGCALVALLVVAGCGGADLVPIRNLDGAEVARMAERELEAQNPGLASGALVCADLRLEVGRSVRCLRTTELSGGRIVKVRGTVTVTSRASGGRLHVAMDREAEEFGLSGSALAAGVRGAYLRRLHRDPGTVDCPYLPGRVGATVTCRAAVGRPRQVQVVVTRTDPATYATTYTLGPAA